MICYNSGVQLDTARFHPDSAEGSAALIADNGGLRAALLSFHTAGSKAHFTDSTITPFHQAGVSLNACFFRYFSSS